MNLNQKIIDKINSGNHEKKLHRYSASNIYALLKGWEKPETYLEPKIFNFKEAFRMWQGINKHKEIQELLPEYEQEVKIEKEIDGLTIVGMADLMNKEEILEIKTSTKLHQKAKPWHTHQLKLYLTLFEKPKGSVVQPVTSNKGLSLKTIGTYERDDEWFKGEIEKLKKIDKIITEHYE
jgi:hypothetical protein